MTLAALAQFYLLTVKFYFFHAAVVLELLLSFWYLRDACMFSLHVNTSVILLFVCEGENDCVTMCV